MQVKTTRVRRNGRVYQYAQLVESYRREDGMPSQRVLASLGVRTDLEIANLRSALDASRSGRAVVVAAADGPRPAAEVLSNLAYLDVAVVLGLLRRLGVPDILTAVLPRTDAETPDGDVVMALVVQRCVAPDSKLAAMEWFGRTALPELLGLPLGRFNNTRLHRVLDALETTEEALQVRLATAISAGKGPFSTLFLDLTDTWFVGAGPELATFGKTKEGLYRRKIGIVLLCDQDGFPLRWSVVEGRTTDSDPMTAMARALQSVDWARGVPLVLDRAMGATAHIEDLLATGQPFLTALRRNEFDAYTDRVPSAAIQEVLWSAADAVAQAGAAAEKAGMIRVRDDLFVLDLGVVTRREQHEAPVAAPVVDANDKCRHRLAVGLAIQSSLHRGEFPTVKEAAQAHGLPRILGSAALRLLRLAPDLQESILAGGASHLTLTQLAKMTWLDNFDVQRKAYDAAIARAMRHGRGAPTPSGRRTAAPPPAPAASVPVRLRALIAFNPEQWARQKKASDKQLAAIREWTRGVNRRLSEPHSHATVASLTSAAHDRLQRDHVLDVFKVTVTTNGDGKVIRFDVDPDREAWARRQRFHGFQVLVSAPEEWRTAADLVATYRAKDAVEKDFQTIKSVLSLRPVRHRTDAKVRAHVTLCMLALLVERKLEHTLAGRMTAPAALELLAEVHLNQIRTTAGSLPVYALTRSGRQQLELLEALHLKALVNEREVTTSLHAR